MRGKQNRGDDNRGPDGITPAHAGKTKNTAVSSGLSVGSPPRVRGKHSVHSDCLRIMGITPACAGKTSLGLNSALFCRDHPRVCGENEDAEVIALSFAGSPPRVRGKPSQLLVDVSVSGITPACAGKT